MESDTKGPLEADEYEVDSSADEDLEAAMREALEAVEATRSQAEEAGDGDGSGSPPAPAQSELDELERLRLEVAELRERSVRTLADFDNFRKRAERERDEERRYAGSEVLRDVLPVVDNLERAIESAAESDELKEGVELILRQILDLLRRHGVERVPALHQPFDPAVHEAVSRREAEDVDTPTVCEEFQAGFTMKDRLLRPSMVVVAVPAGPVRDQEGSD